VTDRVVLTCSVGGSIPVIFTFYSEVIPQLSRGKLMVWLAAFWMVGTIVIAALAWGILSPVVRKPPFFLLRLFFSFLFVFNRLLSLCFFSPSKIFVSMQPQL
jgi:MFS family permease